MDFVQKTYDQVVVVHSLTNVANRSNAQQMKEYLLQHVQEGAIKFLFDCSNIEIIDSTFLGALVVGYKSVYPKGGAIALFGANEAISLTLGLTKLNETFKSYNTMEEALASLK